MGIHCSKQNEHSTNILVIIIKENRACQNDSVAMSTVCEFAPYFSYNIIGDTFYSGDPLTSLCCGSYKFPRVEITLKGYSSFGIFYKFQYLKIEVQEPKNDTQAAWHMDGTFLQDSSDLILESVLFQPYR